MTGSISGTTARVRSWNATTNELEISIANGSFVEGEVVVGSASSAKYQVLSYDDFNDNGFADNDQIEEEADLILDFSESNPFGMP